MFRWFNRDKVAKQVVENLEKLQAELDEQEKQKLLDELNLPENLQWAQNKFKDTSLNNSDLEIKPYVSYSGFNNPRINSGYFVYYKNTYLGEFKLNSTDSVNGLIFNASLFCPELFPVHKNEIYNFYNAITNSTLGQVQEIYMDFESTNPSYILKNLCTGLLFVKTHKDMVYAGKALKRLF